MGIGRKDGRKQGSKGSQGSEGSKRRKGSKGRKEGRKEGRQDETQSCAGCCRAAQGAVAGCHARIIITSKHPGKNAAVAPMDAPKGEARPSPNNGGACQALKLLRCHLSEGQRL